MERALTPEMLSTDLAYYLVRKGVSIQACWGQNRLYPRAKTMTPMAQDVAGQEIGWASVLTTLNKYRRKL